MKLKDLFESGSRTYDFTTDELGDESYAGEFTFEVAYWHEPASHSDHPYGEGTAREHHSANWGIEGGKLKTEAKHINVELTDKRAAEVKMLEKRLKREVDNAGMGGRHVVADSLAEMLKELETKFKGHDVDKDGQVIETYPAGTDIKKLPGWTAKVQAYYEEQLGKALDE